MKESELAEKMMEWEYAYREDLNPADYVLVRLDGRAFHSYTRGLDKPVDSKLKEAMAQTMLYLAKEIQGVRFGYTQSDEISLLITSWREGEELTERKELPFGGNLQKIVSLTAASASAYFNAWRGLQGVDSPSKAPKLATFDSRVFSFPGNDEGLHLTMDYFEWRQKDAQRNSLHSAARTKYSAKQLHGVGRRGQLRLLEEAGMKYELLPADFRHGSYTKMDTVEHTNEQGETYLRTQWSTGVSSDIAELLSANEKYLPSPPS